MGTGDYAWDSMNDGDYDVVGDDPDHGRAQGAGAGEGGGGGRQPHVDRVRLPAARAGALRVRRGRHARAQSQDC